MIVYRMYGRIVYSFMIKQRHVKYRKMTRQGAI